MIIVNTGSRPSPPSDPNAEFPAGPPDLGQPIGLRLHGSEHRLSAFAAGCVLRGILHARGPPLNSSIANGAPRSSKLTDYPPPGSAPSLILALSTQPHIRRAPKSLALACQPESRQATCARPQVARACALFLSLGVPYCRQTCSSLPPRRRRRKNQIPGNRKTCRPATGNR